MQARTNTFLALAFCFTHVCFSQWQSLSHGVTEPVKCFGLNSDSTTLLVGGSFKYAKDSSDSLGVYGLVKWNGIQWDTTGLSAPDTSAMTWTNRWIGAIAYRTDTLITGNWGCFPDWDCNAMQYGTMLHNGIWQPFGDPNFGIELHTVNGRLFFGGDNTDSIFGQFLPGISEYINGSAHPLPNSPFTQSVDIWEATYWHGQYYFGGNTWGELGSPDIVSFDGDSTWSGVAGGMGPGWIGAMAGLGDSLYVGGYFWQGGNNLSSHVQLFDGTQWRPFFPQVEYIGQVWDIQVFQGALYISGIYHFAGESTWYGLLRFDGHDLCAIGGPMPAGDNGKMAFFQGDLYMALAYAFPGLEWEFVGHLPLDGLVPDTCITVVNTGITELTEASLGLYPNPGREQLSLSAPAGAWPADVEVRDMAGCLVHRERLAASTALYTGTWAAGTYTVQLRHRDGTVTRGTWVRLP